MVNYFDYSYALPENRAVPFRASYAVYPAPWNRDTEILHVGIKGFDLPKAARPPANLVFLIDSSRLDGRAQQAAAAPSRRSIFSSTNWARRTASRS